MSNIDKDYLEKALIVLQASAGALRAFKAEFGDDGDREIVDPESGQKWKLRDFYRVQKSALGVAATLYDSLAPADPTASTGLPLPPSVGTIVRTLRMTGRVDLSDPRSVDRELTQRVMEADGGKSERAYPEGRAAVEAGRGITDNPYDIMRDDEALAHLTWRDGFREGEAEKGEEP